MKKEVMIKSLLTWFHLQKRDLPWRMNKDPYRVWVSEIMLQQTRVDTVIPYYERFIKRFPTIEKLANAEEQEVLKYWEGLGYYSRARNLHSAVKEVQSKYGGKVPDQEEEIEKLKGVGPYTKGAILSIAYDKPVPAVDGNVLRVFSRLFAIKKDISLPATRKEMEEIARGIIPHDDPASFNQALMELGALICIPRNPLCSSCPILDFCEAKASGIEQELPIKNKKEKKKEVRLITVITKYKERYLIRRREEQLLKGLWEFPTFEVKKGEPYTVDDLSQAMYEHYQVETHDFHYIGKIQHIFSHLRWDMEVYASEASAMSQFMDEAFQWVASEELEEYPFPVPHQKVMELMKKQNPPNA